MPFLRYSPQDAKLLLAAAGIAAVGVGAAAYFSGYFTAKPQEPASSAPIPDIDLSSLPLKEQFNASIAYSKGRHGTSVVKNSSITAKLQLYGLYKVATCGRCDIEAPSAADFTARAKWDAWRALGDMSQEVAMEQYLALWDSWAPDWRRAPESLRAAASAGNSAVNTGNTTAPSSAAANAPNNGENIDEEAGDDEPSGGSGGSGWMSLTSRPATLLGDADSAEITSEFEDFLAACADAPAESIQTQIEEHPEWLNKAGSTGEYALHMAADSGRADITVALLAAGANVNVVERERGQTPLHYAAAQNNTHVVKILLEHGADQTIQDIDGKTAAALM